MLTFSARLNNNNLLLEDVIVNSFCTSRMKSTKITIRASDPTIEAVVTVETVEMVTVEIIIRSLFLVDQI